MPLFAAELDQVPDDEEVARQSQLLDERQLALDLPAGALVIGLVAAARAFVGALPQKRIHRFAFGHRVLRKLVAEIGEDEFQAGGKLDRVGDGVGEVGEQTRHFGGRLEVALGVFRKQAARRVERGLVADRGEDVKDLALGGGGVADAVGGEERNLPRAGPLDQRLVARLLFPAHVALDFGIDVARAEGVEEPWKTSFSLSQAHQALGVFGDLLACGRALAFLRP